MATPQHKSPSPVGYELNFGRPVLGHHYQKYINFTCFTLKLPPLGVLGHEIYNFLSPYPSNFTYQIWSR